jgi:hypothetical protein
MRGTLEGQDERTIRVARVAAGAAFSAAAAVLFVLGDERDGSLPFFLGWLAAHVAYGILAGSFWALAVVVLCPPLLVALTASNGDDTPLWLQAASIEAFYGVPFTFIGVVGRRLWLARRPPELPSPPRREES